MSWIHRELDRTGSTRLFAILRILTAAVAWSRLAATLYPRADMEPVALVVSIAFWIGSTCMFVGAASRVAALVTGLCTWFVYAHYAPFGDGNLHSHHVLAHGILCCLLALTPCGGSFSVDRLWRGGDETGPLWGLRLLQLQLTAIYVGAIYEKAYPGWMTGERMEQVLGSIYFGSDPPTAAMALLADFIAVPTVIIEAVLPAALLVRSLRVRLGAYALGFAFHAGVYLLTPVATYSVTMFVWLLVMFRPDEVDAFTRSTAPVVPRAEGRPAAFWAVAGLLVAWPIVGRFVPWIPDGRGFVQVGDEVCDVVYANGMHAAGRRARIAPRLCERSDLPDDPVITCVVGGAWTPVDEAELCRREKAPRRRVPAL